MCERLTPAHAGGVLAGCARSPARDDAPDVVVRFHAKILDNMRDAVVLVDPAMNVIGWNRRAEQFTGIVAEMLLGLRRDPVYGVTLTLGMGGVTAEVLADTVTLVWPLSEEEILAGLQRLRLWPLLGDCC